MKNNYHYEPLQSLIFVCRRAGLLLFAGTALLISGNVRADATAPAVTWQDRNSAEATQAVAKQFLDMLVLDPDQMKQDNLANRPEMVEISKLYHDGKYVEGMNRYFALFYDKLRHPEAHGINPADVDPASGGVANIGNYPPIMMPTENSKHDSWVNQTAVVAKDRAADIAAADQLLENKSGLGELGAPGSVDWNFGKKAKPGAPPDMQIPDASVFSGMAFTPLLEAYIITHDPKYLNKWVDYMDDWSLNSHYVEGVEPCFIGDSVSNSSLMATHMLTRLLQAVAVNSAPGKEGIPIRVMAEILMKRLNVFVLQGLIYTRSNTHNWTPGADGLAMALFYDEFKLAPALFTQARRRSVEDNAVTQNLRDGTENQEDPWYNGNYLTVASALPLIKSRATLPENQELPCVEEVRDDANWWPEIQDHLDEHITYRIHLRVGSDQWPIPFRGGDARNAAISEGNSGVNPVIFPKAWSDPTNMAILAATQPAKGAARGPGPSYTSDWYPYAGFNTARDGWEKTSGYGALFCSPMPSAYGAYRGLENNNTFGLNAYGQDLLIDDCTGHYMHVGSPLLVDQTPEFFNEGVYKVQGLPAHKVYEVSAWTDPSPFRWHSSDNFNLMEGVYSGPYADENTKPGPGAPPLPTDKTHFGMIPRGYGITDVSHDRLAMEVRKEKLWIITDRLTTPAAHEYTLDWMLPAAPSALPAFDPSQVAVDAKTRSVVTHAETTPITDRSGKEKPVPKVNLSMYQFTTAGLTYSTNVVPEPIKKSFHFMYGWLHVNIDWKGTGNQQVVSALLPRPSGSGAEADFKSIKQITGGKSAVGFEAVMPDGATVDYLASPDDGDTLTLGNVTVQGGNLLLSGDSGMALDCTSMTVGGKDVTPPGKDFEFSTAGGNVTFTPIYRPIEPVIVGPDRNVFTDSIDMTLTSKTPGVEIHYTLDGTTPTPQSPLYTKPVTLTESAVVKACAYRPGVKENPLTQTGTEATAVSLGVFTKQPPQETVSGGSAPGLQARYWQDDWKKLWFYLDDLKPQASQVAPGLFDLSFVPGDNPALGSAPAPRTKYYAVDYTGFLNVPQDGVYTFHAPREFVYPDIQSGYDLRVYVGDNIDPKTKENHGPLPWYPSTRLHALGNWSIALKKGAHSFRVVFIDYRTNAASRLNLAGVNDYVWTGSTPDLRISGPGLEPEPIPNGWLTH